MNKLENFLSISIEDPKKFSIALNNAMREIRAEELNIDFMQLNMDGDKHSQHKINQSSLYSLEGLQNSNNLDSITQKINSTLDSWKDTAVVYRGTRLPDNNSSFGLAGIHTTPHINIANAYATGATNDNNGLGRLLKYGNAGFISSYEVPLNTRTYKNFEFEDIKKSGVDNTHTTLGQLKESITNLSRCQEEYYLNSNEVASPALKDYYGVINNQSHYETIIPTDTPVNNLYFKFSRDVIELNLKNPKYEQVLARVQEASLRDFYEVLPLERLLQQTSYVKESEDNIILLNKTKSLIFEAKQEFINAPWECNSLKDASLNDSTYSKKRPYITNSQFVGSAMDNSSIDRPEITKKLETIVEAIRTNDLNNAHNLLEQLQPTNLQQDKKEMVNSSNLMDSIKSMRKKYQHEEKIVFPKLNFK